MRRSRKFAVFSVRRVRALRPPEHPARPRWPVIVLRTPKGWTGPKVVDGKQVEGTWRAHQVPLTDFKNPAHLQELERWMKSYKPLELFDEQGQAACRHRGACAARQARMGANPHANGGLLLKPLQMPALREHAVDVGAPGSIEAESTRVLGKFLRDVMKLNLANANFRLFGPGRNRIEPPAGRLRGIRQGVDGGNRARRRRFER
jgi:xylulose-5-phosphate/fructose-6-phosphate phosphoketolase